LENWYYLVTFLTGGEGGVSDFNNQFPRLKFKNGFYIRGGGGPEVNKSSNFPNISQLRERLSCFPI